MLKMKKMMVKLITKLLGKQAFDDLFEFIRTDIILSKKIVPVTFLASKLESFILSADSEAKLSMTNSTRKKLRRRLESELADVIQIFPDGKGKLLMVPGNVTLHDLVLEVQSARNELEIWKTNVGENNRIIDQASLKIRSAIKEDMKPTPLPFYPSDATTNLSIPHV